MLYVKDVIGKGRGVFSDVPIEENEIIEISPIIRIPKEEVEYIAKTSLSKYCLAWPGGLAFGLGLVSLYNHDENNNAEFCRVIDCNCVLIQATRRIEAEEEICTNYNRPPGIDI